MSGHFGGQGDFSREWMCFMDALRLATPCAGWPVGARQEGRPCRPPGTPRQPAQPGGLGVCRVTGCVAGSGSLRCGKKNSCRKHRRDFDLINGCRRRKLAKCSTTRIQPRTCEVPPNSQSSEASMSMEEQDKSSPCNIEEHTAIQAGKHCGRGAPRNPLAADKSYASPCWVFLHVLVGS